MYDFEEVKNFEAKVLQTYRPSDEAGPRGAFAPKKGFLRSYFNFFFRL